MGLSDQQEAVKVTLCIEDWALVILAMGQASVPMESKDRINRIIFDSARKTERALS